MNFVYLAPDFPPNFRDFVRGLHETGVQILGLGETPEEQLPSPLKDWLRDYIRLDSLQDYEQVYRAFAGLIQKHGRIDWIDCNAEFWMETEARLRTDFNLAGFQLADMPRIKSKWAMKQTFLGAGVPVARGCLASQPSGVLSLAEEVGFPLVAKPDIGVGAAATYRLNDRAELEAFLAHPPDSEYLVEEYLAGQLCTYDGLANSRSEPVLVASHTFRTGIMEVVNDRADLFFYSERQVPQDLDELGRKVLRAFQVKQRFFHLEFFRTPQGLRILEANLRAPGALVTNMMCYAADVDVFKMWAELVVQDRSDFPYHPAYHVAYYARRDERNYQLDHEQVLKRFGEQFVLHQVNEPLFRQATGDSCYVLRSPDLEVLFQAAEALFA